VRVRWLTGATRSLRGIHAHIALDDPEAARRVVRRIRASVEKLKAFSNAGRTGQVAATRELVIPGLPYIVVYHLTAESVDILRVFHSATANR
jgi:plasmid stabilization system protein ParE